MAFIKSLGAHLPTALDFLISESILPQNPSKDLYTWKTYIDGLDFYGEEEVIITERCVVWSQNGVVCRVFKFDIEDQKINQALLTWFDNDVKVNGKQSSDAVLLDLSQNPHSHPPGKTSDSHNLHIAPGAKQSPQSNANESLRLSRSRALVIILQQKAHVYHLHGSSHIINLPFEVERAFPAPRGLLLQRRITASNAPPPSPMPMTVPFNTFIASQSQGTSRLNLRTLPEAPNRRKRSSNVSHLSRSLSDFVFDHSPPAVDTMPRLFTLTDAVAEMGLAVEIRPRSQVSAGEKAVLEYTVEDIGLDEDLIYVSALDELSSPTDTTDSDLILLLTVSRIRKTYSVWSASYLDWERASAIDRSKSKRTATSPPKPRASLATRKSTGPGTPGMTSKRTRESFTRGNTGRGSLSTSQAVNRFDEHTNSDELTESDLAASIGATLDSPRLEKITNRRTSSILARAELSSHDQATFTDIARNHSANGGSFAIPNRRGQSFGGQNNAMVRDRASGRHTIAEPTSQSSESTAHLRQSVGGNSILEDQNATNEDELFSGFEAAEHFSRLRKELVMKRILTRAIGDPFASHDISMLPSPDDVEVFAVASSGYGEGSPQARRSITLYVMNRASCILSAIYLNTTVNRSKGHAYLNSPNSALTHATVTVHNTDFRAYRNVIDAVRITDDNIVRVFRLVRGMDGRETMSLCPDWIATALDRNHSSTSGSSSHVENYQPIVLNFPDSIFQPSKNIMDHYTVTQFSPPRTQQDRTLWKHPRMNRVDNPGGLGKYDVIDEFEQCHRFQVEMWPRNPYIAKILTTCRLILLESHPGTDIMLSAWWRVRQKLEDKVDCSEWTAVVVVLFCFAIACLKDTDSLLFAGSDSLDSLTHVSVGKLPASDSHPVGKVGQSSISLQQANGVWPIAPALTWLNDTFLTTDSGGDEEMPADRDSASFNSASHPNYILQCASRAKDMLRTDKHGAGQLFGGSLSTTVIQSRTILSRLLVALHLIREEQKLNIMSEEVCNASHGGLAPVLAQIGHWLGWKSWNWEAGSYYSLENTGLNLLQFDNTIIDAKGVHVPPFEPPSIYEWLERAIGSMSGEDYPSIGSIYDIFPSTRHEKVITQNEWNRISASVTPRTIAIVALIRDRNRSHVSMRNTIETFFHQHIDTKTLETLPEGIVASLRNYITLCHANPPTTWPNSALKLIDREDLERLQEENLDEGSDTDDMTKLIYPLDNRFSEAVVLLNSRLVALGEYNPKPEISEAMFLDEQKAFAQDLYRRTMSLPAGEALLGFCSRAPHPMQKIDTPIFNTSCNIQPSNITVDVDKAPFGEDKAGWAYFHAGVAAGLYTARNAPNIETSWLTLNKPTELGVRHAGLLFALGLNGHLKKMARWLAFKYLTPKHDMTTIGLLLGMAASYFGTMDTLITRLLSVHVPRLLPPGAAELNLSPLTQTAGIMGIGLLYCNSQHRRMSEVMLSEIEHADVDDPTSFSASPGVAHRDEGYRLAAGFAIGLINLGRGRNLRILHDLRVAERLLAVGTGPREINVIHILDRATSGAIIALALIFLKSHDTAIANKVGVPSTLRQLDYARPDLLLLRTVARNLIMWNDIEPSNAWIWRNLPHELSKKTSPTSLFHVPRYLPKRGEKPDSGLKEGPLSSERLPYYNILAGSCWSISLKYAGTGSIEARDCVLYFFDQVTKLLGLKGPLNTFDEKLTKNALERIQHSLALSTATIMAGTGDLDVFRRLRILHANVQENSTFGFHQAAHMAMGALFLGRGLYTFSTSNLAIASLLCAFYPIFAKDAMDNSAHLQAFRYFWTFAAEPRCIIARDVETNDPIVTPIVVLLRDGVEVSLTAPRLLPELDLISRVSTTSPEYWQVTLDFERNPHHLANFRKHQTIFLRRKSLLSQYHTPFSIALATRSEYTYGAQANPFGALLNLAVFARIGISRAEALSILPRGFDQVSQNTQLSLVTSKATPVSSILDARTTSVDDLLVLGLSVDSENRDRLMGLRALFKWADREKKEGKQLKWLSEEGVETLKAAVLRRLKREWSERRRSEGDEGVAMVVDG